MKTYTYLLRLLPVWALLTLGLVSCEYIHEDLKPCDHYLHFTYTYNMKFADAFAHEMVNQSADKQVDLFVFDAEGKFLSSRVIAGDELLANRVKLQLEPGDYRLLAWAGLNDTDYAWTKPAAGESMDEWLMSVRQDEGVVARELSGLFQGTLELTIPSGGETDTEFPLVKNTNKIRLALIDANSGTGLQADDFTILATTHNGDLNAQNQPVADDAVLWKPYLQQVETVADTEGGTAMQAVVAELNTMRLMDGSQTSLQLSHKGEATPFLQVDLTDFLLLTQMESHDLDAQEYLDRQDEYTIVVYLDIVDGKAHCLEIIVNDWTIRLDDVNLGGKEA